MSQLLTVAHVVIYIGNKGDIHRNLKTTISKLQPVISTF